MSFLNKNFFIRFAIIDAVFFIVFYFTFVFTFPIKEIVDNNKEDIAQKTKKIIKYDDISLGLGLSLKIKNLEIIEDNNKKEKTSKTTKDDKKNKISSLKMESLTIKPNIMAMISSRKADLDFDAMLMGGEISGNFSVITEIKGKGKTKKIEKNKVTLNIEDINLKKISDYLNLDLPYSGKINGDVKTVFATMRGKPVISYLNLDLDLNDTKLGPGKVKAMGSYVTIDAIRLGSFKLKGSTPKNSSKFKLEPVKINSPDLKADLEGSITFSRSIMPNLKLKFKFTDELLENNKKIRAVMSGITNLKRKDGYYGVKLTGTLKHLRQRPWLR